MKKIILLTLLIAIVSVSLCVGEETIENHTDVGEVQPEVNETPQTSLKDCPVMNPILDQLQPLYENPYNKGSGYLALSLPEDFTNANSMIDGYTIEYPYGNKIFCYGTKLYNTTYEFKCLDWNVKTEIDGVETLKKMKIYLEADLEFEGYKNSIKSMRYLGTDCRVSG